MVFLFGQLQVEVILVVSVCTRYVSYYIRFMELCAQPCLREYFTVPTASLYKVCCCVELIQTVSVT